MKCRQAQNGARAVSDLLAQDDGVDVMRSGWLIIFDCDGVLVDTETIANKRLATMLTERGLPTSYEQSRARFLGTAIKGLREKVLAEDGVDVGADFATQWMSGIDAMFAGKTAQVPGVSDMLDTVEQAGHTLCVASSGEVAKMKITLGSACLWERLSDVVFSADMVARGKPAPDLFLHAARAMNFAPSRCVVIEDSPFGAQAARAATMTCFGYAGDPLTNVDGLRQQGAKVFRCMADLPCLIADHIASADTI